MPSSPHESWKNLQEDARLRYSSDYATWFAPIEFVSFKDNNLRISMPNNFFIKYIQEHYGTFLQQKANQYFGGGTQGKPVQIYVVNREVEKEAEQQRRAAVARQEKERKIQEAFQSHLNPHYTLDSFVPGVSNKTAHSMAKSIINDPGKSAFNPFFIFGPSGVGKTHLANAIGLEIIAKHPGKRVLMVSVHEFQTQFVSANLEKKINDFLAFYQSIDVLIIDDIQELVTPKTQQAFFHIFNHLQHLQHQIIMTCDRPPHQIEGMEDRITSRLKWGVVIEIERPDIQLRKDILHAKIRRDGLDVPEDVIQYVAAHVKSNVRDLEGVLNSLLAYSVMEDGELTITLATRIISRFVSMTEQEVSAEDIIAAVAKHCGVRRADLKSKSRKAPIVRARQLAMYLCHKRDMSYARIGKELGKRDHSTVVYGCEQVEHAIATSRDFRIEVENLEASLKGGMAKRS